MKFFLLFLLASILFTVIVYFRLIRKLVKRKSLRILWLIFTAVLSLSFECALKIPNRFGPDDFLFQLAVIGYYIMAAALCLLGIVAFRDIVLGVFRAKKAIKQHQHKTQKEGTEKRIQLSQEIDKIESRREFLNHIGSWAVLGATAVCAPTVIYRTKHSRAIRKTELTFSNLPPQFDGLRIVHLSDIHAGNTIDLDDIEDIVIETNALNPDIIVITGDIADGIPDKIARFLEPMRGFQSTYGIYYVTGNHEHGWDGKGWVEAVTRLGFKFLNNEHQYIEKDSAQIAICGAIDYRGDRRVPGWKSDPVKALNDIPSNIFKLMLVHQPNSIDISFEHGADLVLAGHTHGGQFWPACYIVDAIYKYARGLYNNGNRYAFVSCGTGYWGPAFRFGIPPEIGLHVLRSRQTTGETQREPHLTNPQPENTPVQNNIQSNANANEIQIPDETPNDPSLPHSQSENTPVQNNIQAEISQNEIQIPVQAQNQPSFPKSESEFNLIQNIIPAETTPNDTQIHDLLQMNDNIEETKPLIGLEHKQYCLSLKDDAQKEACCTALAHETTYSCDKKLACEGSTGVFLRKCCRNLAPQSAGQRECCARLENEYPPLKCDVSQSNHFKTVPNDPFNDERTYKGRDRSLNIYRDLVQ